MRAWRLRHATPADAGSVALVHVRSWAATYPATSVGNSLWPMVVDARAETWAARIADARPREQLVVAVAARTVMGFAWAGPTTDPDDDPARVGQVRSIHVDPNVQGRGCGTALLAAVTEALASSGYAHMTLWVVDSNHAARSFYESHGWEPDGATRREPLAMPGESGRTVTVVRYRADAPQSAD